MEARKLFESVAKVMKCTKKGCKKHIDDYEAEKKKKVDPLRAKLMKLTNESEKNSIMKQLMPAIKQLQESKQNEKLNHCMATKCDRENRANFKVLASYHKKDCADSKNKKACKLAKVSESYAKKSKYTGSDMIKYKKIEMA
jgi:hypothetical protein